MFKRLKNSKIEHCSSALHPEHQQTDTRISEYLRKYGVGKLDDLPSDHRPEVSDDRDVEQMLDDDALLDHMATDELDVLMELDRKREDFERMRSEIELNEKQTAAYDEALKILNSPNSKFDEKQQAYRVIDELIQDGKVTRARAYN